MLPYAFFVKKSIRVFSLANRSSFERDNDVFVFGLYIFTPKEFTNMGQQNFLISEQSLRSLYEKKFFSMKGAVGKWWSPTKETLTSEDFHQILLFLTFSVHVVVFSPKSMLSVCNSIFYFFKTNSLLLQSRVSQSVHARNIKGNTTRFRSRQGLFVIKKDRFLTQTRNFETWMVRVI